MILFLTIVSGLAWTVVYVDAIRIGFRDRSYAIPAAALGLNFAWEAIHASHPWPQESPCKASSTSSGAWPTS